MTDGSSANVEECSQPLLTVESVYKRLVKEVLWTRGGPQEDITYMVMVDEV